MARTDEDIVDIELQLTSRVSIDLERLVEDPIWTMLCVTSEQIDEISYKQLIQRYLEHYIIRERLLSDCPCTNGPADMTIKDIK